jgi:uncharacterized protein (TIGR00661 family)
MKILYAIQGTGNGHISRARDIIPILQLKGDVDILISGDSEQLEIPFTVHYRLHGLGFTFGKKGGIDFWKTYKNVSIKNVVKEIRSLPVEQYDIIINDFEPISAWAGRLKKVPVISLSHQSAVLHKKSPKAKKFGWLEHLAMKWYAPAKYHYGFHFQSYHKTIFTPVIRDEIRRQKPSNKGHYAVYLPAYSDQKMIKVLSQFKHIKWHVFSKHSTESYVANNILISPIHNENFIKSLVSSKGILCGAGFEAPAEALFLRKKLLVIPMKSQFEQKCNAEALRQMGVLVLKKLSLKYTQQIKAWLQNDEMVHVDYPDMTADILSMIFEKHAYKKPKNKLQLPEIGMNKLPANH